MSPTSAETIRSARLPTRAAETPLARRLSLELLLDLIAIGRGEADALDALIASAIIQANVQEIVRRADLQVSFAGGEEIPTDEMRRPVTMNAVASSLKLPFETVRRRIGRMAADGFCRFVDGGVIVPSAVLQDPKYAVDAFRGYEAIRAGYYRLRDLGLVEPLPAPTVELSAAAFPIRTVARLFGAYVLRVVEAMGGMGDLVDGLLLLELYRANVEHLPAETAAADPGVAGDGVADEMRRPLTSSALAVRLGLASETVRRRTTALAARGACRREPGGLVAPAVVVAEGVLAAPVATNAAQLQRLLAALSQLGVLKVWDGLRPA